MRVGGAGELSCLLVGLGEGIGEVLQVSQEKVDVSERMDEQIGV